MGKDRLRDKCWLVYRYDINKDEIVKFNVFDHVSFRNNVNILLEKTKEIGEFSEKVDKEAMYYFWSKSEYEVIISCFTASKHNDSDIKVDIYDQLKLNWDSFIKYTWNAK